MKKASHCGNDNIRENNQEVLLAYSTNGEPAFFTTILLTIVRRLLITLFNPLHSLKVTLLLFDKSLFYVLFDEPEHIADQGLGFNLLARLSFNLVRQGKRQVFFINFSRFERYTEGAKAHRIILYANRKNDV